MELNIDISSNFKIYNINTEIKIKYYNFHIFYSNIYH